MLSKAQEKLIKSLQTKKGREKSGLCLVEGKKVIETAGDAIKYTFTKEDTEQFTHLVTTETPQEIAAVATIPQWDESDVLKSKIVVVLDGVQDPGNMGAIFRLCLAFNASLILIDSVDPTNPKVIRSSVGALFHIPYLRMHQEEAKAFFQNQERSIIRLEKVQDAQPLEKMKTNECFLIAGSEGNGISLSLEGESIYIEHSGKLESLNVANALAIVLHHWK